MITTPDWKSHVLVYSPEVMADHFLSQWPSEQKPTYSYGVTYMYILNVTM